MLSFFHTKTFIIVNLFKPAIITKIHSSCMTQKMKLLALFFSLFPVFLSAQICNSNGNVALFSNYEGGILNINVDVNIPNLKIGVCTYNVTQINIAGPFAGNVSQVIYAGFDAVSTSCGVPNNSTTVTGVPANIVTFYAYSTNTGAIANYLGDTLPFVSVPLVNCMVGADGACANTASGGGNSSPQIVQFFLTEFGAGSVLYAHFTDYVCFTGTYNISNYGNCCLETPVTPPNPIYQGGSNYSFFPADTTLPCGGALTLDLSFYQVLYQPPTYPGYVWSNGTTGPIITITTPGTYIVTVGDYCHYPGGVGLLTDTIVVTGSSGGSVASFSLSDTNVCVGTPIDVTFTGSASPSAVFNWNFGAATILSGSGQGPYQILFPNAGTPSVSLSITDNGCTSAVFSQNININALPIANISSNVPSICIGQSATLTATGGTTYSWNNGMTNATQTVSPIIPTTYTVFVANAANCADTTSFTLNTLAKPSISISPNPVSVCLGGTIDLNATGAVSYVWNNGTMGATNTLTPLVTTTYTVIGTAANTCTDTASILVSVNPVLTTNINVIGSPNICLGDSVTLQANTSFATYSWNTNAISNSINVSQSGNYSFIATDINGCLYQSNTVAINVNPAPQIQLLSLNNESCFGANDGSIEVSIISGTPNYIVSWNGNPAQNTNLLNNLGAGNYSVQVIDANVCSATANYTLTSPQLLNVSTNILQNILCAGDNNGEIAAIVNGGTQPYIYAWSNGSTSSTIQNLGTGTHVLSVTDANNCADTVQTQLASPPPLSLSITGLSNDTLLAGSSLPLNVIMTPANGTYNYQWSPTNFLSCYTCPNPIFGAARTITYQLLVSTPSGCVIDTSITMYVIKETLYVPTAFSPNGDDANDNFVVLGTNISSIKCDIFDRNGRIIHTLNGLNELWNGTDKQGKPLPEGSYLYHVVYTNANGALKDKTGFVTLLR